MRSKAGGVRETVVRLGGRIMSGRDRRGEKSADGREGL